MAAGSKFLSCIGHVPHKLYVKNFKDNHFSLMADESTNISSITEGTVLLRFVDG
jgi:hypothetical protein